MAPYLIALLGCTEPQSFDALLGPPPPGLPESYVGIAVTQGRAVVFGHNLAIEERRIELDDSLAEMVWSPALDGLPDAPWVLGIDRAVSAVHATAVASNNPAVIGFSVGDGVNAFEPAAFDSLYAHPDDPRIFPDLASALASTHRPTLGYDSVAFWYESVLEGVRRRDATGPRRNAWLTELLAVLVNADPNGEPAIWCATALTLGGEPLDAMPVGAHAAEFASANAARHRQQTEVPADWSTPEERRAWQQERWLANPMPPEVTAHLRRALTENPTLLSRLRSIQDDQEFWVAERPPLEGRVLQASPRRASTRIVAGPPPAPWTAPEPEEETAVRMNGDDPRWTDLERRLAEAANRFGEHILNNCSQRIATRGAQPFPIPGGPIAGMIRHEEPNDSSIVIGFQRSWDPRGSSTVIPAVVRVNRDRPSPEAPRGTKGRRSGWSARPPPIRARPAECVLGGAPQE